MSSFDSNMSNEPSCTLILTTPSGLFRTEGRVRIVEQLRTQFNRGEGQWLDFFSPPMDYEWQPEDVASLFKRAMSCHLSRSGQINSSHLSTPNVPYPCLGFLRELPEPLFTTAHNSKFVALMAEGDLTQRAKHYQDLLALIPPVHDRVVKEVLFFFSQVPPCRPSRLTQTLFRWLPTRLRTR